MKKQELIEKLKLAGSVSENVFIPVSNVIDMIEDLEDSGSEDLEDIVDIHGIAGDIVSKMGSKGEYLIDSFEIEADTSGNSIDVSLSNVEFDVYEIESIVEKTLRSFIGKEKESNVE